MTIPDASPIRLYDTTLRDGTQREGLSLSVEDKVKIARASTGSASTTSRAAGPAPIPRTPSSSAACSEARSLGREGRRVRQHPPGGRTLRGRREHPRAGRRRDAGRHPGRQELDPPRGAGAGDDARGEPADDRRERRLLQAARTGGGLRRRALLRRLAARPRVRARDARTRRPKPAPTGRALRHQRRRAARGRGRAGPGAARAPGGAARHPSAQRRRAGGGQRARRGAGGLRAGAGHDQRLRRALRQPRPGAADRQPPAQAGLPRADRRRRSAG